MRSKKAAEAVSNEYSDGQLDGDSSAKVRSAPIVQSRRLSDDRLTAPLTARIR
jgi:hypothetical protein